MEVCLWIRFASASGRGVGSTKGLCSMVSFWKRVFVMVVMSRPYGAWSRISLLLVGWCVISNAPVGMASRSGLIGLVVYVVCRGCHPSGCIEGKGGDVGVFLRVGAFVVV